MVDAQQAGHGVGHLRGVQRADEGQVATGGVREPGHRPGGVGGGLLAHRVDGARRAERDDHVARPHPQAQRRRHVVARPRGDDRGVPGPGVVERSEDLGDDRVPVPLAVDDPQQVPAVGALVGRPVARPRRVAAVGREATGQAPREPVVGQQHPGQPRPVLRLAAVQPRQLRHRERGDRHAAAGLRPRGRAPVELLDQPARVGRGLRVVPELGRPDDLAGGVHGHHAVLLAGDGDRRDRGPAELVPAALEGRPPGLGILLRSGRAGRRVGRGGQALPLTRVGVTQLDLGRLGRGVDPGDEGHPGRSPSGRAGSAAADAVVVLRCRRVRVGGHLCLPRPVGRPIVRGATAGRMMAGI